MEERSAESEPDQEEADDDESMYSSDDDDYQFLTEQEHAWAVEIKAAAEAPDSGILPMSDFSYVQYALVTKGRLEEALARIKGVQQFQSHYQVSDDPSRGISVIEQFMALQPRALLNLDICLEQDRGEGVIAFDASQYNPSLAETLSPEHADPEHNWKIHILFWYYAVRAVQIDFRAIRQGIVLLVDTAGMDWSNVDMSHEQRCFVELRKHYPWIAKETRVYNCSFVACMWISMLKAFIQSQHSQAIQMACEIGHHGGQQRDPNLPRRKLSDLYLQPNANRAARYLLSSARELLNERHENEQSFRL
ncbi:expressed unknown protein [Seminavis robusta]|uniref:CRAL-TRIO domain-containing protein n=1 Tax=Seminavis robusta TaxID=568900 RepID=A0A9N8DLR5_9STRA|nr:expressed unknown protein [Seminavis robusta]|eukprot:Sro227_g092240.1 n/a (306) ;mRNA; f:32376-33293